VSVVKEIPPSIARGRTASAKHSDIAEKLKADPGEWYRIGENLKTGTLATGINNGKLAAFRTDEGYFEAASRTLDEGVSVWARYVLPTRSEGEGGLDDETVAVYDESAGAGGAPAE
jgi:hypothetical protein